MKAAKKKIEKFKEAARAAECDEDERAFDEKLGKIANAKVGPRSGVKDDRRGHQ